jgi:peptide/nickel transport system ATP-binding protein
MPNQTEPLFKAVGLSKEFGFGRQKTLAVNQVDLALEEGEVITIVGESGSGKTTLAKMILGLISPTGGEVFFRGEPRVPALSARN